MRKRSIAPINIIRNVVPFVKLLFEGGNEAMTTIDEGEGQLARQKPVRHKRADAQRNEQALLAAAAEAGEISADIDVYELMRGIGNLCVGADNDPRYDARRRCPPHGRAARRGTPPIALDLIRTMRLRMWSSFSRKRCPHVHD
jgi:hypothetical protein